MTQLVFSSVGEVADRLPRRCAVILADGATGAFISGVPMFANAQVELRAPAGAHLTTVPLGVLATDHVGYVSWDLEPLRLRIAHLVVPPTTVALLAIEVDIAGPLGERVDILTESAEGNDVLVHRHFTVPDAVHRLESGAVPAMQTPSLGDWYISPASFSYVPAEVVGQDGCEALLPSNIATNEFRATQVVLGADPRSATIEHDPDRIVPAGHLFGVSWFEKLGMTDDEQTAKIQASKSPPKAGEVDETGIMLASAEFSEPFGSTARLGIVVTYDITWIPVGHGLGQLVYSLPLAPGEMTRIAVVDWARSVSASRDEAIQATDALTHVQLRDRTIDEVVTSAASEFQGGGSLLGSIASIAATAAGTVAGGPAGGFAANRAASSLGLGFGASVSAGDRDVTAHTTNKLADSIQQHSTLVRDQRSTVVVQSAQSETGTASSRVVRNYNHSHAMTVLYYEVLRHYRVVVRSDQGRPAILIRRPIALFTPSAVVTHRLVLEQLLIDPALRPGFAIIEQLIGYAMLKQAPVKDAAAEPILGFELSLRNGGHFNPDVTNSYRATLGVLPADGLGGTVRLRAPNGNEELGQGSMGQHGSTWDRVTVHADTTLSDGRPTPALTWRQLSGPLIATITLGDRDEDTHLDVQEIVLTAITLSGARQEVAHGGPTYVKGTNANAITVPAIPPPPIPQDVPPLERITLDERMLVLRLLAHLNSNRAFYWRQIWMHEDPNARLLANPAAEVEIGGTKWPLFSALDNAIVDVVGDECVFFLDPATVEGMTLPTPAARTTERLVSHPTRGVFAEAKLGHCNASEFIDDRRFWDWQKSPIPDAAEATPSLSGRSSDPVTSAPTLATPGVTIVNPAAAPDPSGLVAVIAATLKEGAFRDTSMAGEVGGAVKSALDGATEAVTTPIPGTPTEEKPKDPKTPDPKVPDPKVPDPKVSDPKVPDPKPKAGDVLSPTGTHAGHTTPTPKQPATTTYGNTRAFKQVTVVVARDASVEVLALASVELRNAAGGQQRASLIDASEVSFDNVPASWTQVSVILNDLKLRQWGNRSDTPMLSIPNGWRADVSLGSGRTKIKFSAETDAITKDVTTSESLMNQVQTSIAQENAYALSAAITPKVISKDVFDVSLNLGASEQVKIVQSGSQTAGETKASAVTLHLILRKLDPSRAPKVEVIKDGA
jgi:hypothetical protein